MKRYSVTSNAVFKSLGGQYTLYSDAAKLAKAYRYLKATNRLGLCLNECIRSILCPNEKTLKVNYKLEEYDQKSNALYNEVMKND